MHQFYTFKCCIGFGRGITAAQTSPVRRANSPDHPNPALAITEVPSPAISRIGWALRVLLLTDNSSCLKDRKVRWLWFMVKILTKEKEKVKQTSAKDARKNIYLCIECAAPTIIKKKKRERPN